MEVEESQDGTETTEGNFCTIRIIIDKFLLKLFNNNKNLLKNYVKYLEVQLNDIYKEADVFVNSLPLQFKVVDLQFHDEDYCEREGNSPGISQHHCHILSQVLTICRS